MLGKKSTLDKKKGHYLSQLSLSFSSMREFIFRLPDKLFWNTQIIKLEGFQKMPLRNTLFHLKKGLWKCIFCEHSGAESGKKGREEVDAKYLEI